LLDEHSQQNMGAQKIGVAVYFWAISIIVLVSLVTPIWAQGGPSTPLSEFGRLPEGESGQTVPSEEINQSSPDDSARGNSEYEDFLGCLSDSIEEGAVVSETKRAVDNCFSSSYTEEDEENSVQVDDPARNGEREDDLPSLH
jgi:hypothetical protein